MTSEYKRCWARGVSACDGGMSGEHVISRGLWVSKGIDVVGGPFGSNKRTIPLNGFVTKCLCTKHNSLASDLDSAALDAYCAIRETARIIREGTRTPVVLKLDGWRFERWLLKTAFNYAASIRKEVTWSPSAKQAGWVLDQSPSPIASPMGLWMSAIVGDRARSAESFDRQETELHLAFDSSGGVFLFRLRVFGYHFLARLTDEPYVMAEDRYNEENMMRHPKEIRTSDGQVRVRFRWLPSPSFVACPELARARGRWRAPPR